MNKALRRSHRMFLVVAGLLLGAGTVCAAQFQSALTFPSVGSGVQLENFPVPVRIAEGKPVGFRYADCPTADSLAFRSRDGGTCLPFEVDTWNPTGESLVWVCVPVVERASQIDMIWSPAADANPAPECVNAAAEVWRRAGYLGVWHLNEVDAEGQFADSTENALHAKRCSSGSGSGLPAVFTSAPSPLGGAYAGNSKNGVLQNVGGALVPPTKFAEIDFHGTLNFSGWLCRYNVGSASRFLASGENGTYGFNLLATLSGFYFMSMPRDDVAERIAMDYCIGKDYTHDGNNPLHWINPNSEAAGVWRYVDMLVRADGSVRAFENGAKVCDNDNPGVRVAAAQNPRRKGLCLGAFTDFSNAFGGYFDEFRISTNEHSHAWMQTEHAMQADADFVAMSQAKEVVEKGIDHAVTEVGAAYAQISASASGATYGTYYTGVAPHGMDITTVAVSGRSLNQTFKRLQAVTDYDYVVAYTNEDGVGWQTVTGTFRTLDVAIFSHEAAVTVAPHAGSSVLANFPCLVRVSPARVKGFSYSQCRDDGSDVRFYTADGQLVPSELDIWDAEGESLFWVSLPSYPGLGGDSVLLKMKWGAQDGAPVPDVRPAEVWTRADYVGVWHLSKALSDGSYADSTGHGLTAAPKTGVSYPQRDVTAFAADGRFLGGALEMGGQTSGAGLVVPSAKSESLALTVPFTLSSWVKYHGGSSGRILTTGADYNSVNITCGQDKGTKGTVLHVMGKSASYFSGMDAGTPIDCWQCLAGVFDGNGSRAYCNGAEMSNSPGRAFVPSSYPLVSGIGLGVLTGWDAAFDGAVDEARIRNVASSADWLAAEHASVMTDMAIVSEATVPESPLELKDVEIGGDQQTGLVMSWCVPWAGDGADTVTVECEYGMDPNNLDWCRTVQTDSIGSQNAALRQCLLPNRTYWARLKVTNGSQTVRSQTFQVLTGDGPYEVEPEQPIISIAETRRGVDNIVLSGTLMTQGGDVCEGAVITVACKGQEFSGDVASDGTWTVVVLGLPEYQNTSYEISAVSADGKTDRMQGSAWTRSRSEADYTWAAQEPSAWTNRAAWTTVPEGCGSYPAGDARSASFPAHCCATVMVSSGALEVRNLSFGSPECLRLLGIGATPRLNYDTAGSVLFGEDSHVRFDNMRLLTLVWRKDLSIGEGSSVELYDNSQLMFLGRIDMASSSILIAGSSSFLGGNERKIAFADIDLTIDDGKLYVFQLFDGAAKDGLPGSRLTLRGDAGTIVVNSPLNGVSSGKAAFYSSNADMSISFELTAEPRTCIPIDCVASADNSLMGDGEGSGRIVLNVPKTAAIADYRKALEIPVVNWPDGIDTNRVVFGKTARRSDSFAYTWPENAAPDACPTGVVYRHAARQGMAIILH